MTDINKVKEVLKKHGLEEHTGTVDVEGVFSEVWKAADFKISLGWSDGFFCVSFWDMDFESEHYSLRSFDDEPGYMLDFQEDFTPEFFLKTCDLQNDILKAVYSTK